MSNVYQQNGFENRREYLIDLADNYCVDQGVVMSLAGMLGPSEDFDGLVSALEDIESSSDFFDDDDDDDDDDWMPLKFSESEVENGELIDGDLTVRKEGRGVVAEIVKMDEDFVAIYIEDWNGNTFTEAFQSSKALSEAVNHANRILQTKAVYN